jgi:hypothetical protein
VAVAGLLLAVLGALLGILGDAPASPAASTSAATQLAGDGQPGDEMPAPVRRSSRSLRSAARDAPRDVPRADTGGIPASTPTRAGRPPAPGPGAPARTDARSPATLQVFRL